jgi:hypothetical protein
MRNGV